MFRTWFRVVLKLPPNNSKMETTPVIPPITHPAQDSVAPVPEDKPPTMPSIGNIGHTLKVAIRQTEMQVEGRLAQLLSEVSQHIRTRIHAHCTRAHKHARHTHTSNTLVRLWAKRRRSVDLFVDTMNSASRRYNFDYDTDLSRWRR